MQMPHAIREEHLDDICAKCKKPHGNSIELLFQHHKVYEVITCNNCGYEMIKLKAETLSKDRLDFY
jgi:hypothetical protein